MTGDPRAYARNRFRIGDRVRFSPTGEAQFPGMRLKVGTVIGFGREDHLVRVRRGPRGRPELYHMDLIEAETARPPEEPAP